MLTRNVELTVEQLRRVCDPSQFQFVSTAELPVLDEIIGQDRAVRAASFGIGIESPGYHMYAMGPSGTGRMTMIKQFLDQKAAQRSIPDDWCYVNNFENSDRPRALRLPAGKGLGFYKAMERLTKDLQAEVPRAFESEAYQQRQEQLEQEVHSRRQELFNQLTASAEAKGFTVVAASHGVLFVPVINGHVSSPAELETLDDVTRQQIESHLEELQGQMREAMRRVRELQKERDERMQELDRQVVGLAVDQLLEEVIEKYSELEAVVQFLHDVRAHILATVQALKQPGQVEQIPFAARLGSLQPAFEQYRVNLIVDNSQATGAPVIVEGNPNYHNLLGRVEHEAQFGALVTDFTMK